MKSLFASLLLKGTGAAEELPMEFHMDSAGLTVAIVLVLILAFVVRFLVRRRARRPSIATAVPISSLRIVREFLWLLVPLGVLGSFALMGSPAEFASAFVGPPMETDATSDRALTTSTPPLTEPLPLPTDDRSHSVHSADDAHSPEWVNQPRVVDGDTVLLVVASQQYSTQNEAEAELQSTVAQIVQDDLQRICSVPFRPAHWRPSNKDVVRRAVQRRYMEVVERDFGTFFHPMYRVWWQVELSPTVRSEFLPVWRRALVQYRIAVVGVFLSVLAMLVSSLVMYYRMDGLTGGSARRTLQVLAGGTMIVWTGLISAALFGGSQWFAGRLW